MCCNELIPNSETADINLLKMLRETYGHINMGIYLKPLNDGEINVADIIKQNWWKFSKDWIILKTDKLPPLTKYLSTSGSKVLKPKFLILTPVNKFSMWNDSISMID